MIAVFRVDASVQIGTGHVMRCLTLAKQLQKKNVETHFICRNFSGNLMSFIRKSGFNVFKLPLIETEDSIKWCEENWEKDAHETKKILKECVDILIVDHYAFDEKWEKKLLSKTRKIMVIDDLANRKHICNVILDQNYYREYQNRYDSLVPESCKKLLGPSFLLLRDEFLKIKPRKRDGHIKRIMVSFGGSDPTNETLSTLMVLKKIVDVSVEIDVIIGELNPHKDKIVNFCKKYSNFNSYIQVSNIAEIMNNADLVIGAGGSSIWERCFLGLPSITIIVADNQYELTNSVSSLGGTFSIGRSTSHDLLKKIDAIQELLNNPEKVRKMSTNASKIIDREIILKLPVLTSVMGEIYGKN